MSTPIEYTVDFFRDDTLHFKNPTFTVKILGENSLNDYRQIDKRCYWNGELRSIIVVDQSSQLKSFRPYVDNYMFRFTDEDGTEYTRATQAQFDYWNTITPEHQNTDNAKVYKMAVSALKNETR